MKKYFFCIFIFTVMLFNVYAKGNEKIRVGLYYGKSAPDSVTIHCNGNDITVSKSDAVDNVSFYPADNDDVIKVNGTPYKGGIIISVDKSGILTVVNEVDIEEYVSSVIAKEMSSGFETEALKAQAVCARTYAIASSGRHELFDVCASIHCQVYGGASSGDEKTAQAAGQTKGKFLTYKGEPIQTVYFATSGGHTESAEYIWGSRIPYLVGVPDEYESSDCYLYRWTKELSPKRVTEIMEAGGYNVGNVKSIEVLEKTQNGVVYKLKVVGDKGEKIFQHEWCRILFGGILPSQAYSVTTNSAVKLHTFTGEVKLSDLHILSAEGISRRNGNELTLKGDSDRIISAPEQSENFIFSGRGNGHLVGMSQNGANGMAKAGFTYDKILTHYYRGTEIVNIEHQGI